MSVTTTYRLPTAEDFLWLEDLVCTVESHLDEIHSALKAPLDGNPETDAEPATLDHVGRVFLFTRFLRDYAGMFIERADRIENAIVELRDIQEETDGLLLDKESYSAYVTRHARQWNEAAKSADETFEYAKARGRVDAS